MTPSEVFNHQMFNDHGGGHWTIFQDYWGIEMAIAATAGIPYSEIEDYSDPETRTCGLCGNVVHTGELGTPLPCDDETCCAAREFWNMRDLRRPLPGHEGHKPDSAKRLRGQWFRAQLMKQYGVGQIYKIPMERRLDATLALQLFRMGMEGAKHVELTN